MTRMAVDLATLDRWSTDATRVGARLAASVARADDVVARLDARWDGQASELFAGHFADWHAAAGRLTSTLDELVSLVGTAHANYRSAVVANGRMWPVGKSGGPVVEAMSAGGRGRIDAEPDDFRAAAAFLARQGDRLDVAHRDLGTALADSAGAAGDDPAATAFGADYDALVAALRSGWQAGRGVVTALADAVAETGNNLLRAEHASTARSRTAPALIPPAPPPPSPPPTPPAVAGSNWLAVAGPLAYWPSGDPGRLGVAAQAWQDAAGSLRDVAATTTAAGLTAANTGPSLPRLDHYVGGVARPFLEALAAACEQLGTACALLAAQIERTRTAIEAAVDAVLAPTAERLRHPLDALVDLLTGGGPAMAIGSAVDLLEFRAGMERIRDEHERSVAALHAQLAPAAERLAGLTASVQRPEPLKADTTPVTPPGTDPQAADPAAVLNPGVRTIDPPRLTLDRSQIEKKYEQHAAAFGVTEPRGEQGFVHLEVELRLFVTDPATVHVDGTYRSQPMIIHVDPSRHLVVLQKHDGSFVSGWALNADQERNIMERGSL